MGGDLKLKYPGSTPLDLTALASLAASQTWIAGWASAYVVNTSNLYEDYAYGGKLISHASNRQAGTINIYVIGSLDGTPTWPTLSSGAISSSVGAAIAFADIYRRNAAVRLLWSIDCDTTASAPYEFPETSIAWLFGFCPTHHCLFIAGNISTTTTAWLAASPGALYVSPKLRQYT